MSMTHKQRIEALKRGETLKRPAFSAWGHVMNLSDLNAEDFARATIAFQEANDFDFVKVMSNPYYMIEDMGLHLVREADYRIPTRRDSAHLPIHSASDWEHIRFPSLENGSLAREISAIEKIVDHFQGDVPVLPSIFTPITWVQYLAIPESTLAKAYQETGSCLAALEKYLIENEKAVRPVLEHFQELNIRYMEKLLSVGADGFFYAIEYGDDLWQQGSFEQFVRTYDIPALKEIRDRSFFNLLHLCGNHSVRLDLVKDYPVDAINWFDRGPENPSIQKGVQITGKFPAGGIDHIALFHEPDRNLLYRNLLSQMKEALMESSGKIILSGGCAFTVADTYRFMLIQEALDEIEQAPSSQ